MRYLLIALRLILAVVFGYAAYTKLSQSYLVFAMSIDSYQLLPEGAVLLVARWLPWLELAVGIGLLLPWGLRISSTIATLLLAAFFAIMVRSYVTGLGIDCGCFGLGEAISPGTLIRDGILLALTVVLTVFAFLRKDRNQAASESASVSASWQRTQ